MLLHRIVLAAHSATAADAFSGRGGLYGKGRWHSQGRVIVYAAQHKSLAMAESLVHIQRSNSIEAFNHYTIAVPDALILPVLAGVLSIVLGAAMMFVLAPVLMTSIYVGYRDIFLATSGVVVDQAADAGA